MGERDLLREDLALHVARRVVVVVVETALAHSDDLGLDQQCFEPFDAVRGVVGMHARGRPDAVEGARHRDGRPRMLDRGADGDETRDPRGPGLGHLGGRGLHVVRQMAVVVRPKLLVRH